MNPRHILLTLLLLSLTLPAGASDFAKEQRWAEQLQDGLLVGEALQLDAGARKFFAIYTPASGPQLRGGVLLLHGMGAHPDWPEVIHPLRTELPARGWATLSIQLPVRPNGAEPGDYPPLFPEAFERIQAGIQYLQGRGIQNIVLLGHSLGATMGAAFLAQGGGASSPVQAFVGIGMNRSDNPLMNTPASLEKITLPVLDIYGALDLDGVKSSVEARAVAARKAGNKAFRQMEIPAADHFFRDQETLLLNRVSGWLVQAAPGRELKSSMGQVGAN